MLLRISLLLAFITLPFITCRPFIRFDNEADKIRHQAELLLEETDYLVSSIKVAASLAVMTIRDSYRRTVALDRKAALFAATATASMIADEALKTVVMKEAQKIDAVFSIDRSEEITMALLSAYGYPALHGVIAAVVSYYGNRLEPSSPPDDSVPDIEAIIRPYLKRFSIENTIEIIQGFGTKEYTPDYIAGVDMKSVNTDHYCATRNWKDNGLVYQYRINDGNLEMKRGDGGWQTFNQLPFRTIPVSVAADNNRCMVLTADHEIWWYCVKDDQAQWTMDILDKAVDLMSLTSAVRGQVCEIMLPLMIQTVDTIATMASSMKYFKHWKALFTSGDGSSPYWSQRCTFWTDAVLSIDRMLLKAANGTTFTAADYACWSKKAHVAGTWSNLLSWRSGDRTFFRGQNLSPEAITDIAVGNWNSTVSTAYVLAEDKIWYIDEEIIQPEWRPIERWNKQWAILGTKEYEPIVNSPYPLDSTCRIDASNSVVGVLKGNADTAMISWLRWDFHQKDDFIYLPVDWCEHEWHSVPCPHGVSREFRINTSGDIDPRKKGTVWSIPAPKFTFYNYLPVAGYEGMFGEVPRSQVSVYPVLLSIRIVPDTIAIFSVSQSDRVPGPDDHWRRMPVP